MIDPTIYKIAIAAFLHDIGKFAERAELSDAPGFHASVDFLNDNAQYYQPEFNGRYSHKHAVYTAAFIDHIEKLLPREFNKGEWGLGDSFMNLAAGHHLPKTPLQWVIAMADRVSSGFDRDEFDSYNKGIAVKGIAVKDYKKTRLLTIFEGISTDGNWKEDSLDAFKFRFPLRELSPETVFPVDDPEYRKPDGEQASKEYAALFFNFIDALEKLEHRRNIPLWFEHFDSLFMIYGSHIPAATVGKVVPDVSLYDHSRTTAALASAIYLYHQQDDSLKVERISNYEDNKFLLVTGDFYGIQDFIFSEGGGTNRASAKLLRGRSFAVSLISELASHILCREIGLTPVSVILNAAGKFTVIAPNTKEVKEKIRSVEEKVNDWLIRMFYGEVSMGFSSVDASCNDFTSERFPDLWERLARSSERKKFSKFDLDKYGGAVEGYLDGFDNELARKLCPYCGKRPSSAEVENDGLLGEAGSACTICRDHIYIGTNLVKAPKIAITTTAAALYGGLKEPIFGEYQVSLDVDGKLSKLSDEGTLLKYWDITGADRDGNISKNITAKFINGYVPVYRDEDGHDERLLAGRKSDETKLELIDALKQGEKAPKTFLHIAKKALNETDKPGKFNGIEALGVLKADVDNLGLVFACGLRRNSLSRLATLSRQMNHFFAVYLPHALSTKPEFRDIYTVFAGGDDLFLIGPWNRIVDFAGFIRQEFQRYVCGNTQITISTGISLNKPGVPVPTIAETAEHALKAAKHNGRDSVTLFGETVKWAEFERLSGVKETVRTWQEKGYINNAMLFRFNTFAEMAKQKEIIRKSGDSIEMDDWDALMWESKFKYNLVRNIAKGLKGEAKEHAIREVEQAAKWLQDYGGAMKIPVWQIIYNQR